MAEDDVELRGDPFGISHVFEYRHAAYRLLNGPADDQELLARPICYLARHALELALKTALVHADAEYHHAEIGYRPFEMVWVGHDLKAGQPRAQASSNREPGATTEGPTRPPPTPRA